MIQGIYEIRRVRSVEYMRLAQAKYQLAVRPVYGIQRRGVAPKHIGSCVLLSVDGARFLATAGHVTDWGKGTALHVAGSKELVPLSFTSNPGVTSNPEVPRDMDPYDFSVCVLSNEMQQDLGDVRYILEKDILSRPPFGADRIRMTMGYPTSKNKRGIDNSAKYIAGTAWTYASLAGASASNEDHILIAFDDRQSFNVDGVGTHSLMPTGASGGGLFDLGRLDDPERLAIPPRCQAKLVGILIEYRKENKVIVATRMEPILDACRQLRDAMRP